MNLLGKGSGKLKTKLKNCCCILLVIIISVILAKKSRNLPTGKDYLTFFGEYVKV